MESLSRTVFEPSAIMASNERIGTIDSQNLSNLYFRHDDSSLAIDDAYVHPGIVISNDEKQVIHGRGMIVERKINPGECLFITPPTVGLDLNTLRARFLEVGDSNLEDVAMTMLEDNMMEVIQKREKASLNSFLPLMGSLLSKEGKDVTIEILTANDEIEVWSDEELSKINRKDIKNIILKNAFGPDFITYKKIEHQWKTSSDSSYLPPHILGVFPLAAMLNHSCVANAIRTYVNGTMIVHACQTIQPGTEIVWSYIPPTQVFAERRRALKRRHGFLCKCERCLVEAKELRRDILPSNVKLALEEARKWNDVLIDVSTCENVLKRQLCGAFVNLDETVFKSTSLSNHVKRHLRVGFTNLHFNYFNAMLSANGTSGSNAQQAQELVLNAATQLHFAFCVSNNASTEHISVLHLCYELMSVIHQTNRDATKNQVKFWTEAMKKTHMTRYGEMGSDLEAVRKCLVHTRTILRQRDGFLKTQFRFL